MSPKFSLLPAHLGDANVITFPSFVGTASFLVRRSRLENNGIYLSTEHIKKSGFEYDPVAGDYGDDATIMGFFRDDTATPRVQFYRTPLFIADDYGDGVIFVSAEGEHAIFDRKVADAAGINNLFRLNSPEVTPPVNLGDGEEENEPEEPGATAAMFTDAAEGPGDVIIVCCEVKLPQMPMIKAWLEVVAPSAAQPVASHPVDNLVPAKSDASDKVNQSFGAAQSAPASTHEPVSNQPGPKKPMFIPPGAVMVSGASSSSSAPVVPINPTNKP